MQGVITIGIVAAIIGLSITITGPATPLITAIAVGGTVLVPIIYFAHKKRNGQ